MEVEEQRDWGKEEWGEEEELVEEVALLNG